MVHLGDSDWCIVDSCQARGSNVPVAIEYLTSFGPDTLDRVRLVVATHWHDDHIKGLASVFKMSPNARFACSTAMKDTQFLMLVESARAAIQGESGVDEFASIYDSLVERAEAAKVKRVATPKWAIQDRKLLELPGLGRSFPVTITALSPSDGTVALALEGIAAQLPKVGDPQQRIPNVTPNQASVVLWIQAGPFRALLGADLEHSNNVDVGWRAILSSHQDTERAFVFKVPHHGSENADCPEVWGKMLKENPFAVVTPFSLDLPGASDFKRMAERTANLYCTSSGPGKPPRRDPAVEKAAKYVAAKRRVLQGKPGHVRVRWSANLKKSAPSVELFNGAYSAG